MTNGRKYFCIKIKREIVNIIKNILEFLSGEDPKRNIPPVIIKKEAEDLNIKEYQSIEEAIADLENDPNVSVDKIHILKESIQTLKNKTSIKIKDGEIDK